LTLLCALSLAAADAATKKLMSDYSARDLVVVRFAVTGVVLLPLLLLQPWPELPRAFWGWVASLVPFELAAMWLYMKAIRQAPLSQTLPYLAFTPVITIATGYLLLGERVSLVGAAGILLVTSGAYLLNIQQTRNASPYALLLPFKAMFDNPGPRWMLGVALLYSLTSVMGKGALRHADPDFFGPFYFALLGSLVAVPYIASQGGRLGVLGRRPLALLIVGGFMALMVYTHFRAIQLVEVAYMISVKRTSLLFGIVLGAWLFAERDLGRNLVAGTLMVAGVFLIAV
jgi:drug/metabolite transporter (DMT)-like permease